ncbi:MAG: Tex family protein [Pseudomonadota bacterium]
MNLSHVSLITDELHLTIQQVQAVASLLEEDASIPFIARYRKEATGSLDEVSIASIRDRLGQLQELDSRRSAILNSLEQHGHLTDSLSQSVMAATTLSELEDLYLPFRPKRRTRATMAREKGLEPLALLLLEQSGIDPIRAAAPYVDPEKGVNAPEEALSGARDILAERIAEDSEARARIRRLFAEKGVFVSQVAAGKEVEGVKYKDYFDWNEPVCQAPSHRILAMRRGENEDILNLSVLPPEPDAIQILETLFVTGGGDDANQVRLAIQDGYKRLLSRSMETEIRVSTKERADVEAIRIFADNLKQLLLAPPLGAKQVMGLDPGFRTGCKLVCLDRQGKLLYHDTIYPHLSESQTRQAAGKVTEICSRFEIEAIAVGNGTAGRETEAFLKSAGLPGRISIIMVNESGASIYSASEVAREEFPDLDLTVRGSVSIARRLMDPLSELVKIDPKSIGVGQYQHDVDQSALKQSLDDVVINCVNHVGVDVNQASSQLLTYVSGLGPQLAKNIVLHRNENGPFNSRQALKKVKRLGPKAYEQAAGFLRIREGINPLDASAVHPESYKTVDAMAKDLECTVTDLMKTPELRSRIDISRYVTGSVGLPTLKDILNELAKPGRDPREPFEMGFTSGVEKMEDLCIGMKLPGIVTNVTAFGAFVDLGVHQDGLVHVSELSDRFVKNPQDVVKVNQKVQVTVLDVDLDRKRISLSMKSAPDPGASPHPPHPGPDRKTDLKKGARKPLKEKPVPFNNPFADLFHKG